MISIIVPIYNSANYLVQCIDSIIRQSYTDWELILVDDGSKDQSGRICDEYAKQDHRITVIHQSNKGVSSARNVGIAIAKGEYLCFVDADDWLEPSFLLDFRIGEIKADFYISGYIFNIDGHPFSYKKFEEKYAFGTFGISNEFFRQNLQTNGFPWGKLFKTSIVRENRLLFNEKMSINEDHLFVLHYFLMINSLFINTCVDYQYRVFDITGQKLSGKKHYYKEYIENFNSFNSLLEIIKEKWNLNINLYVGLYTCFVVKKRLYAMEALVVNKEREFFEDEIFYWIRNPITLNVKMDNILVAIIRSSLPKFLKWNILKILYEIKKIYYKHRNVESAIYRYVLSNSVLYN